MIAHTNIRSRRLTGVNAAATSLLVILLSWACNSPQKPIDAETRHRIDSTITAQTRLAQLEIDSLCNLQRKTNMNHLVDSIKRVRQREIEDKLRAIPR